MVSAIRWKIGASGALLASVFALACNSFLGNEPGTLFNDAGVIDGDAGAVDGGDTTPGSDTVSCASGTKSCFGTCVDVLRWEFGCTSADSCAACSFAHASPYQGCPSGQCGIGSCTSGYGDCNSDASDGCEANLGSSSSCGTCGKSCPVATPFCTPDAGGFTCSISCPLTICDSTQCVDTNTSLDHCGGCNAPCAVSNGTASCDAGACTRACAAGSHVCSKGGAYDCASDIDTSRCGSSCTDCAAVIPVLGNHQTRACNTGKCAALCSTGFGDCDGNPFTGCESDLTRDDRHCGACNKQCNRDERCQDGQCQHGGGH